MYHINLLFLLIFHNQLHLKFTKIRHTIPNTHFCINGCKKRKRLFDTNVLQCFEITSENTSYKCLNGSDG